MSFRPAILCSLAMGMLCTWIAACGTDAVGISQCRAIEATRCRAGAACGLVSDLDACVRFSRDHCLHGTATSGTPNAGDVRDCADMLEQARECALDSRRTTPSACSIALVPGADADNVCDVIVEPEFARDCSFLSEVPIDDDDDEPNPPGDQDAGGDGGN